MTFDWGPLIPHLLHDGRQYLRSAATRTQLLNAQWTSSDLELRALLTGAIQAQMQLDSFFTRVGLLHDSLTFECVERLPVRVVVKAAMLSRRQQINTAAASIDADLPDGETLPSSYQLVIEELLDNSLLFRKDGRPLQVHIQAARLPSAVRITYTDTACGWDPDLSSKVFQPFRRLDMRGGNGLGMAIAKAVVDSAGGMIDVSTSPAGSTFIITAPF